MYPPSFTNLEALNSIFFCLSNREEISFFTTSISGFFCIKPEPEHGASIKTQSNFSLSSAFKKSSFIIVEFILSLFKLALKVRILFFDISIDFTLNPKSIS